MCLAKKGDGDPSGSARRRAERRRGRVSQAEAARGGAGWGRTWEVADPARRPVRASPLLTRSLVLRSSPNMVSRAFCLPLA